MQPGWLASTLGLSEGTVLRFAWRFWAILWGTSSQVCKNEPEFDLCGSQILSMSVTTTHYSAIMLKTWDFYGLLDCETMWWCGIISMFWSTMLPPSPQRQRQQGPQKCWHPTTHNPEDCNLNHSRLSTVT